VIVPETPQAFFTEFLPALIDSSRSASGVSTEDAGWRSRRAVSSAGVAVRVVGVGEWTLRVSERALTVSPGVAEDVALQLSLRGEDFSTLVVEPMRRALAAAQASSTGESALAARSFWARLGRFDEETVLLLRQQEGRILVRVDDAGRSRNVALTPGLQQWSLDTAECQIDCDLTALRELEDKQKNPLDLFYEGQIRISGDAQIALALAGLFL
jgi:SCP-2 sterol transfer family protein